MEQAPWRIDRDAESRPPGVRGFVHWWLENDRNPHKVYVDAVLVVIIVLSIIVIVAEVSIEPRRSPFVRWTNLACLAFFILEYILRFWVATDFRADVRDRGLLRAVGRKLGWMVRPYPLIDLVAIIPATRSLRSLRLFRLLRVARLLRVFKLARYSQSLSGYVRELRKRSLEFLALGCVVLGVLLFGAISIYTIEGGTNEALGTFPDAVWWSVVTMTTVGYGDIYPTTTPGRAVAILLMLTSIGVVGTIGGMITSTIMNRIELMRAGRVARLDLEGHVIFCGWTPAARKTADFLSEAGVLDDRSLVVVTEGDLPRRDDILPVEGDFNDPGILESVDVERAAFAVVFHESATGASRERADRRAILTTLQITTMEPAVHTITEVLEREGARLVTDRVQGDEVVYKETVDGDLILNALENPGRATDLLYGLSGLHGPGLRARPVEDVVDPAGDATTAGEVRARLLERAAPTELLGYVGPDDEPVLLPPDGCELPAGTVLYLLEEEARLA